MRICTERIFIHSNSKLLRILKILQMEVEGLLAVQQSIVHRKIDLPTIAMPTCPKCRRQTLLRRWSDMYNKTDTVKANVGIHWWTIGCTPPNLHNWEPGLTQEWARSYRFARTCVKSSTTFSRVTYKPHAIHLNRAPPQDHCQEIHMQCRCTTSMVFIHAEQCRTEKSIKGFSSFYVHAAAFSAPHWKER